MFEQSIFPRFTPKGKSFTNPSQAFAKDFRRRKSIDINNNHTLSPIKNKSFTGRGTRAVFRVCVPL